MKTPPDITIHLPAEHFITLSHVIREGIQRARLDSITRREISTWWEAESEFITDELQSSKKT